MGLTRQLFKPRRIITCPGCGRRRPIHGRGHCNGCYKRLFWRNETEPAKRRREYEGSNMNKTGVAPGAHPRGARQCRVCNRFKSRPSSVCGYCGDDPVSHNGDRFAYDQAMGYEN